MDTVDLALILAVDGSASVTYDEFGLIAGGMAAALRDPAVVRASPPARPRVPVRPASLVRRRPTGSAHQLDADRLTLRRRRLRRRRRQHVARRPAGRPRSGRHCWPRSPCSRTCPRRQRATCRRDRRRPLQRWDRSRPIRDRMVAADITINASVSCMRNRICWTPTPRR